MEQRSTNVVMHHMPITRGHREKLLGHRALTLWFTGLPSSGKSTLAAAAETVLHRKGYLTYTLDGDNVRHGLNRDLGFQPQDRQENIRRIAEVARLFRDAGVTNLVAFISPYKRERELARSLAQEGDFAEVFVDCPVGVCEQRDPKGLYKKAREGLIREYTGISAPYESPDNPEIHLRTDSLTVEECTAAIVDFVEARSSTMR